MRIGTAGSELGLAQANSIAAALTAQSGSPPEIVVISPSVDTSRAAQSGSRVSAGVVTELRDALTSGAVDVVVHSVEDLPTAAHPGVTLAAITKRADARDALCARSSFTMDTLPEAARVGADSARRIAQLRGRRPDLEPVDIGGGVGERLGMVVSGEVDAVVLAAASLDRLGRLDAVTEYFGLDGWPTTPGQGALAVEVRAGEEKLVSALDHRSSRIIVEAERRTLALMEAGCLAPVGAHALIDDGMLFLSARVYSLDGSQRVTSSHALYLDDTRDPAGDLAARFAAELFDVGAEGLAGTQ